MTDTVLIHRAEEAKRLLGSDLFADALTSVKMDALLELAKVDADSFNKITRLQSIVHVIDEIKSFLEAAITRTGANDGGLVMPATRPKANKAH